MNHAKFDGPLIKDNKTASKNNEHETSRKQLYVLRKDLLTINDSIKDLCWEIHLLNMKVGRR